MDNQFSRPASPMPDNSQEWNPQEYNSPPQPMPQHQPEVYGGAVKRGGFFKYLLVLVLIAAAAAGVYYWQNQKVSDLNKQLKDSSAAVNSLSSQLANARNSASALSSAGDPATVTIKELTLQLTLPGSLKDLTYKVLDVNYKKPNNTLGTYSTAFLSTTALDKLESGKCASTGFKADSNPPLGFLTKTTGQYPKAPTADNSTGTLIKQFTDYYVAYRTSATGCFADAKNNDTAKKLSDQLVLVLNPVIEKK
jgi:type II secretory pathway pseudopilin PulG